MNLLVIIGFYLTVKIGNYKLGIIFIIIPSVLWYYSTYFKRKLILGNLIIASFIAVIPILVPIIEFPLLKANYHEGLREMILTFNELLEWIIAFGVFSFIMILIYNSVKEIMNIEGDRECNYKTIPIVFGIKISKVIIISLSLFAIALSSGFLIRNMLNGITVAYYLFFILMPFVFFIFALSRLKENSNTTRLSLYPKIIMIFGLLYALVVYYIMNF